MAAKKNGSGLLFHIIITLIGVGGAFFGGWKIAGAGQGDAQKQLSDLQSGIDANKTLAGANKKLVDANKRAVASSLQKITSLAYTVSRDSASKKLEPASTGKGMTYVNQVLGLKWVRRPADGHRYCLIPYPLPWHYAQDFAEKVGGSLVVIDDEEENKWIVDTFGESTEFWIGLTDEVEESKWLWVTDLDLMYKNWAPGEPDNYRKMQHHVIMNKEAAKGLGQPGKWNDIGCNEIRIGIVEMAR